MESTGDGNGTLKNKEYEVEMPQMDLFSLWLDDPG